VPYRNKADKARQMRRYRARLRAQKHGYPVTQSPLRSPVTQGSMRSVPVNQGLVRSVPATQAAVRGVPATQVPVRSVPLQPERRPMARGVTTLQPERGPMARPSQRVSEARPANPSLTAPRKPNVSAVGMLSRVKDPSINASRDRRVRRISEIPQDALDRAGIQRSGGTLSAGPGVDIPRFMKMWLK
jgi:hypothetical protein